MFLIFLQYSNYISIYFAHITFMLMKLKKYLLILSLSLLFNDSLVGQNFSIARIHYSGGGDWYADPSSLPNLINFISENTTIKIEPNEFKIKLTDQELYNHTYLYLTGHGNIRLNDEEIGAFGAIYFRARSCMQMIIMG